MPYKCTQTLGRAGSISRGALVSKDHLTPPPPRFMDDITVASSSAAWGGGRKKRHLVARKVDGFRSVPAINGNRVW